VCGMERSEVESRSTLGKYHLIASLGSGGMADVYLAVAQGPAGFNKLVVVKCLRKHWMEEEILEDAGRVGQQEFVQMFLEEARLAARLNHPNIVQTNEVGMEDGEYFIAMEYLEGQPLSRITSRAWRSSSNIPLGAALSIVVQTLTALHHAHELRDFDGTPLHVVHRDASPHNIFVTYDGQTKLVDFGIAKAASRSFETRTGILKGKVQYMSPEQARCFDVDRRADIFSLGVILWELLAGRRMWAGANEITVLQALVSEPVVDLASVAPQVDAGLRAIVRRATAIDPKDRYATAEEMRLELSSWLSANLPVVSPQDIGAYVADLFADKRKQIGQLVESQFAKLASGASFGVATMDPLMQTREAVRVLPGDTSSSSAPSARSLASLSAPRSTSPSGHPPTDPTLTSGPTLTTVTTPGAPRSPSTSKTIWIALVGAALLGVGVATMVSGRLGPRPRPAQTGAPTPTEAPQAQIAPPAVATVTTTTTPTVDDAAIRNVVKLRVEVEPSDAKIFVDDIKVDGPSYEGVFPKDGASHRLRVEAPGMKTEKRLVVFDVDRHEKIILAKTDSPRVETMAQPPKTPVSDPQPVVVTPPPTEKPAGPGKPPKRPVDPGDPWAK
jgi:eukaryotic-like serine/threonine-protein kinase